LSSYATSQRLELLEVVEEEEEIDELVPALVVSALFELMEATHMADRWRVVKGRLSHDRVVLNI
jgi:hypothetical protein